MCRSRECFLACSDWFVCCVCCRLAVGFCEVHALEVSVVDVLYHMVRVCVVSMLFVELGMLIVDAFIVRAVRGNLSIQLHV